ncbi:ABC transporter permease [Cohnella soli]|uniref:ABC transporter permease n=1 Tax=Cohnella soli TaxID=425005 RepID=A0ABW0HYI6_9BACL
MNIRSRKRGGRQLNQRQLLFLMGLPFIVLTILFYYIPLYGWIYAFVDYKPGIPLSHSAFVGLKYFKLAFSEASNLRQVMINTLALSFLSLLTAPLAVLFAVFLTEMRSAKYRKLIQTTTTLPNFISWVLVYSVFFVFFNLNDGFVNQLLMKLDLIKEPFNMLGSARYAWLFQTFVSVWKSLGWGAIIYMAAIAGIDPEQYDAAKVDGAGRYRMMRHVTIPGVMPTFVVILILSIGNVLSNGFEQFYVFYNPLVADKLEVLDYYVYRIGLTLNDYSFATAIGIFKSVISIILVFSVNILSKKIRGNSVF